MFRFYQPIVGQGELGTAADRPTRIGTGRALTATGRGAWDVGAAPGDDGVIRVQLVAKAAVHAPAIDVRPSPVVGANIGEPSGVREEGHEAKAELAIIPDIGG